MKMTLVVRHLTHWGLVLLPLLFAGPAAAEENTIKIGILHSLSGTMAISEAVLKDTVLMLIRDQNAKGGLLGRKLEPVIADPASDSVAVRRKGARAACQRKRRGCVRLLDVGLAQIRAPGLRATQRPALLPCPVRRRGKLPQHFLHGGCAQPAGNSGGPIPDEQGRRRDSQMGPSWDGLRLSTHNQPDIGGLSCE